MHRQAGYRVPLSLLCASLLLSACGGGGDAPATSTTTPESLGLMKITVSGLGTNAPTSQVELLSPGAAAGGPQPRAITTAPSGIDIKQTAASSVDVGTRGSGGMRYFNAVYSVRNAQFCNKPGTCTAYGVARQNLTLLAARTSTNIDDTGVFGLYRFDGTADTPSIALGILPSHGAILNGTGTGVLVQPGYESMQVYSEAEISGIALDPGATGLLPYGYVVKNVSTPGSRALPANPAVNQFDGQLAFSFKVPLQTVQTDDPYTVMLIVQVVDDSNTRVTQSVEEQTPAGDAVATARAAALGSTDLAVLGGRVAETNIGDPICTVRTAGPSPPSAPTATLVNHGNTPTLASTPYNLQFLARNTAVNGGFCTPMNTAGFGTMVVSGSQSGTRTAAGPYTGTYGGGGTNQLSFTPDAAHPYFIGEQVSYSYTTGLSSSPGNVAATSAFVGSFLVKGSVTSSGSFGGLSNIGLGNNPDGVAVGDFNGDGKLDLAMVNYSDDTVWVLLNNGAGFNKPIVVSLGCAAPAPSCGPFNVVTGDFNGDGKLDLAVTNQISNNVSILIGNGSGGFTASGSAPAGTGPEGIAVGDFNGDGKLDLAVVNDGGNNLSILLGNGTGGFSSVAVKPGVGTSPLAIATGDFNGDGKLDLAVTNDGDGKVEVLLGNGSGGFGSGTVYTVGNDPDAVAVGDFNGDGISDLAVANYNDGTVSILLGKGNGSFGAATPASFAVGSPATSAPSAIAVGDFNGDGKLDLAVADYGDDLVWIALGNGSGGFGAPGSVSTGSGPQGIAVGDFNGDGKLDLATPNFNDGNISILSGQP